MKIIYAATPEISISCLEKLLDSSHELSLVLTMPDKPSGRGKKLMPGRIKKFCIENSLPFMQPENLNDFELAHGSINIHTSILPNYRGAAPIQRAIINGEKSSGITFMKLSEGLDEGPILECFEMVIEEEETAGSLTKKMSKVASNKILQTIENIELNKFKIREQDHSKASYAEKLLKNESCINWDNKAEVIKNMINGFSPNPCAYTTYKKERINIYKARLNSTKSEGAGKIMEFSKNTLLVGAEDFSVELLELSRPGKRKISIADFYNGSRNFVNLGKYLT